MAPLFGEKPAERHLHVVGDGEAARDQRILEARDAANRETLSHILSPRVGRDLGALSLRELQNIAAQQARGQR